MSRKEAEILQHAMQEEKNETAAGDAAGGDAAQLKALLSPKLRAIPT